MVNLYVKLIKMGRMTIDDVPALWRDAVASALEPSETVEG